jgi:hypothetical protein
VIGVAAAGEHSSKGTRVAFTEISKERHIKAGVEAVIAR